IGNCTLSLGSRPIMQEDPPRLRGRFRTSDHVFGHRSVGNLNAQLHQLALNPRSAPDRVLAAHCSNQIASFFRNSRTSWLAVTNLPSPMPTKPLTMPADDRFRLDDDEG